MYCMKCSNAMTTLQKDGPEVNELNVCTFCGAIVFKTEVEGKSFLSYGGTLEGSKSAKQFIDTMIDVVGYRY